MKITSDIKQLKLNMASFIESIAVNKFIPWDREYFNCLFGSFDISAQAISKPYTRITPSE